MLQLMLLFRVWGFEKRMYACVDKHLCACSWGLVVMNMCVLCTCMCLHDPTLLCIYPGS